MEHARDTTGQIQLRCLLSTYSLVVTHRPDHNRSDYAFRYCNHDSYCFQYPEERLFHSLRLPRTLTLLRRGGGIDGVVL